MTSHQFGGEWTQEKLNRLQKYLSAYMKIFTENPKAKKLSPIYVDAFAGTGYLNPKKLSQNQFAPLFDILEDEEAQQFLIGSATIALSIDHPFEEYIFIEQNKKHAKGLKGLENQFSDIADRISIIHGDCNTWLTDWCNRMDWRFNRAVVFLDPYGMQVEWNTLKAIANTKAIDMWLLFPLGHAINRLLTRGEVPREPIANRITKFFGTEDWKSSFYESDTQLSLFGDEKEVVKVADFDSISKYFVERLNTIFTKVAPNPLPLRNRKNIPIYLLCFAAGNPKGAPTAVKIAQHILKE